MDGDEALARFRAVFNSPAFLTLGGDVLALSVEAGRSEVAFHPRAEFCNPFGHVQGGFVTAMLDAACGIAAIAKSDFTCFVPTLDIRTSFIKPAPPERLIAHGQCLQLGKTIAFLEGSLHLPDGTLLARASVTSRVSPMPPR